MASDTYYGAIEAGGTKFVCAVGAGPHAVDAQIRIPTTTPSETFQAVVDFFRSHTAGRRLDAIGIASFGPIDLNPGSETYGYITSTPKPGWKNANFVGTIRNAFDVPIGFDTDVNGAVLAEHKWGAAQDVNSAVYYTIGTGIGGGGIANGQLLHGLMHPEMGHMRLKISDDEVDGFNGACPYHGNCFEGLASGPAMQARWQTPAEQLPIGHPAWTLEAGYIAQAMVNTACILSPERIILGGGVMQQEHLFPMVHKQFMDTMQGYIASVSSAAAVENYIVAPGMGDLVGLGAGFALAEAALLI